MKLLLYCTKSKPYLYRPYEWDCFQYDEASEFYLGKDSLVEIDEKLNGKIVAECDYEIEKIESRYIDNKYYELNGISKKSCLSTYALINYAAKDRIGLELSFYAIHIKNLHIFDEPKKLSDYITKQCQFDKCSTCEYGKKEVHCGTIDMPITKAPQNMMYCYDEKEMKVLISIRPEWLCKILNGEKTVEIRKKVLKGMI